MSKKLIQPRNLQGFRDYLPEAMIPRERLMETARRVYRSYGFSPIDTPALEYEEILTGKSGDSSNEESDVAGEESGKQMYRFEDQGGRRVGMRFDLTVPLARFAAQHINQLGTPFKRYHIAAVWRGEKPQRGRYREFIQCDFDTIGTKSIVADIETALVIHDLIQATGFKSFSIRINNRMVLNGLLEKLELAEYSSDILRSLDKLAKIGGEKVVAEIVKTTGTSQELAQEILRLADLNGTNDEVLAQLEPMVAGSEIGEQGVATLRQVVEGINATGVQRERFTLDVSIARGLDYYTGTVFETYLEDLPTIGSVCSGGRYDNLAGVYTKQELPGIGASLGLDRLLAAMEELQMIEKVSTPAEVLIPYFDKKRLHDYLRLANQIRSHGIGVEVYPEPKKLGQQLKYADRQGFRIALIAGDNEFSEDKCQLKDLQNAMSTEVSMADGCDKLISKIREIIAK